MWQPTRLVYTDYRGLPQVWHSRDGRHVSTDGFGTPVLFGIRGVLGRFSINLLSFEACGNPTTCALEKLSKFSWDCPRAFGF
jgi:hypothetical protein